MTEQSGKSDPEWGAYMQHPEWLENSATPPTPEQAGPSGEARFKALMGLIDEYAKQAGIARQHEPMTSQWAEAVAKHDAARAAVCTALASPGAMPGAPVAWLKPGTNLVVHRDVKSSTNNGHEFTQALVRASPGAMEGAQAAQPVAFAYYYKDGRPFTVAFANDVARIDDNLMSDRPIVKTPLYAHPPIGEPT